MTVFTKAHIISKSKDGKKIKIVGCKVGSHAYDEDGNQYTFSKESLEAYANTWTGGGITLNHMIDDPGKIEKAEFKDPDVIFDLSLENPETIKRVNVNEETGYSQETEVDEIDNETDRNILKHTGKNMSILFYPIQAACSINDGCKKLESNKSDDNTGSPFAGYKDFADCISKNQDKDDPEAYCAVIQKEAEGK